MFKPLQMRKLRVLLLDSYLGSVMNVLGELRSVQITEVKGVEKEIPGEDIIARYSNLLADISFLVEILGISDEEIEKVPIPEGLSADYLGELEGNIARIKEKAASLHERLEETLEEKAILEGDEVALNCLNKLGVDVDWLGMSDFLYVAVGFLDQDGVDELRSRISDATGEDHLIMVESFEDKILAVVATLNVHREDVDGILKALKFDALKLTGRGLGEIEEKLKLIQETEQGLRADLKRIRDERLRDILVARETAQIERNIREVALNFGKTDRVYAIEGWVPEREVDGLVRKVEDASGGCAVVRAYEPKEGDVIPVSFENPRLFKPFESIVEMFGLPSYAEIDPTPILAITFPLIFGLMFGDVGHGAVLALAGFLVASTKKANESYWSLGMILLYCGISAVLFGFLYGSIFGNEEVLPTLWMKPSHHVEEAIGVALFVGVLHMGVGLIASTVNKVQESGLGTIVPSLGKLWFFCGEVAVIASLFKFKIPMFEGVALTYALPDIVLYGIVIPVVFILATELNHGLHPFELKKLLGVLGNGLFEVFETFSMFLSNTISYSRIAILAIIHARMMMAIDAISSMETISGIFILGILIVVGGNILVLVLEGLIVFIHTIRLHFYEWFTKFYKAGGIKYNPFIVERRYTEPTP